MPKSISQLSAATPVGTDQVELARLSATITLTRTDISAAAADNSFNTATGDFAAAGFAVGQRVRIQGFTGDAANNIVSAEITALTSAKMTIGGADGDVIVDDAAGESVTITAWASRRASASQVASALDIQTVTSASTVTPTGTNDLVQVTAQAASLTIADPSAEPADGHGLVIRIKDNGTARSLTWGSAYRAIGAALPTTTVISKQLYLGCVWNDSDGVYDVLPAAQEL